MNTYMEEAVKSIAEAEGLINYSKETSSGSLKGDGYLGVITTLKITGENNKNESKTINCVVKSASNSETLRNSLPIKSAFEIEIYAYSKIIPALKEFEITKKQSPTQCAPKLYHAISLDKHEAVIMENLRESGYRLLSNDFAMDDEHVRLVLQQYARFHATSLAFRSQQFGEFQQLTDRFSDQFIPMARYTMSKSVHSTFEKALKALDTQQDSYAIKAFKSFTSNIDAFYDALVGTSSDEHCVILHGDCWNNNMMFKYGDLSHPTKPTSVKFLDYQFLRMGLPVIDLTYFFYSCSSTNVIDSHSKYLDFYYETFSDHLEKLGCNSQELYPYELFMEHWKKYAKFTLIITPTIVLVGCTELSESVDVEAVAESGADMSSAFDYEPSNMDGFNKRLRYIILHFVNNNLL